MVKGPKLFYRRIILIKTQKKKVLQKLNSVWKNQEKLKNAISSLHMKLHPKSDQIKGFDVTFQMHIVTKVFVIYKYLKKQKKKLPKKAQILFRCLILIKKWNVHSKILIFIFVKYIIANSSYIPKQSFKNIWKI